MFLDRLKTGLARKHSGDGSPSPSSSPASPSAPEHRPWRSTSKEAHRSVLDLTPRDYDPATLLPRSIQVGGYAVRPLVSVQQVRDHLTLFGAFSALAAAAGADFHRVADHAAFEYERWAQTILPGRAGSSSPPSHSPVSPTAGSSSPLSPSAAPLATTELPPLDVLMCWHAHLLNPAQYAHDVEGTYAALHDVPFPLAEAAAAVRSGTLPALLAQTGAGNLRTMPSITGWTPPDVSAAVQRQARIVATVQQQGWFDPRFSASASGTAVFQRCIVRYHAWLDLMAAVDGHPFLPPTLDIEIAWRTHQLRGLRYRAETARLIGAPLDRDRGDEAGLKRAEKLWKTRFRHDYLGPGSQPRGAPVGGRGGAPLRQPARSHTL
ncbi:hypothetical protein Q8F55_000513 [Vanrija albida]|uniref:Uncharacterized protein n=1 Tax=Vanrija albida TaxID=181172 RepID=A0ABR3QDH4_9TREE